MQRTLICLATLSLLVIGASAHGRLTLPAPRDGNVEDPDQPINFNLDDEPESSRFPVNDPNSHPEGQSFVCRVPNSQKSASLLPVTAGQTIDMKWEFTADHPGDGGLFISYDADAADTQQMRFFKIANFPQQRRNNNEVIKVTLPSWLPPGPAVLRWDWYATHNAPWTEFYANCVDIVVSSTSNVVPADIPSYKMEVGTSSSTSYDAYNCEDCWCFDCDANSWKAKGINGPPCVGGVEGNCCDLSFYNPVDYQASSGGGFNECSDKGNSGAAPWLDNSGGGGGGGGSDGGEGVDGSAGGGDGGGEVSLVAIIGGAFAAGVVFTLMVGAVAYAKCSRGGAGKRGGAKKGPKKHGGSMVKMRQQQLRGGQMV
mmetsp:Transcript_24920/g.49601  ORF Transcript_24920/g.49601 Transcript_24920/m.49601 type:complete len:370 (+) Transcript_24920:113-1222(+)